MFTPWSAAIVIVAAATPAVPATAVATVNGAPVSRAEFDKIYSAQKKQYASQFGIDFTSEQGKSIDQEMRTGILGQLIEKQLILNEAKKRNIQATEQTIDDKIAEIKENFPDDASFQKALADNSMKLEDLRERVREGLTIEAVMRAVSANAQVKDKEVADYYAEHNDEYKKPEEVRASHILLKDEKKAQGILAKLRAGEDFAAMAREHSEDPGSGDEGGDLGYFGKGRMVPEFEDAAFSLKPGQISDLVKSQFGYHIIKVVDRRPARTVPLDEVKEDIRQALAKERQSAEFGKWIAQQKASAVIRYSADMAKYAPPAGK